MVRAKRARNAAPSSSVKRAKRGGGGSSSSAAVDLGDIAPLSEGSPTMTLAELRIHVVELAQQKDRFVLQLHQLLRRLIDDRRNRGIFTHPVNPHQQGIPDYFKKIENPMCLTWIKSRLEEIFYQTPEEFCDDVRLVFSNAMVYNPPEHPVHEAAKELLREFEFEYKDLRAKILEEEAKMVSHECDRCDGVPCPMCRTKCSDFQAPVIRCGSPCKARIARHASYYRWGGDRGQHWCAKCFSQLPDTFVGLLGQKLKKTQLERCINDETDTEPWIECKECERSFHAICGLRNMSLPLNGDWVCPLCVLKDCGVSVPKPVPAFRGCHLEGKHGYLVGDSKETQEGRPSTRHSPRGRLPKSKINVFSSAAAIASSNFGAKGVAAPVTTSTEVASKTPVVAGLVPSASDLPKSQMGDYLEHRVRRSVINELLRRDPTRPTPLHDRESAELVASSLTVRVVSNVQSTTPYEPRCSRFVSAQALSVRRPNSPTLEFPHRSKTVLVYQRLSGVDVMLFVLYVQEYDSNCPEPNSNKVYISYLDSVGYMRPRLLRSVVYQQVMKGYFAWVKARGFKRIYIWACPPQRGDAYIIHTHPKYQRTPSSDRLRRWYGSVIQGSMDEGVVWSETNMHDLHLAKFRPLVHTRHSTSRARARAAARSNSSRVDRTSPLRHRALNLERFPYFMGDFPVTEIETALSILEKQDGLAKGTYDASMRDWWLSVWGNETFAKLKTEEGRRAADDLPDDPISWVVESGVDVSGLDVFSLDEISGSSATERDEWIMRRLSAAIKPMKENFLVLKLREDARSYHRRSTHSSNHHHNNKKDPSFKQTKMMEGISLVSDTSDPDQPLPRTVFDTRLALLDMSQHKNLQFDQLRRAKNSSNVLLFLLYKSLRDGLIIEDVEDLDQVEAKWAATG